MLSYEEAVSFFQICSQVELAESYTLTLGTLSLGSKTFPPMSTNRVESIATAQAWERPGLGMSGPACHRVPPVGKNSDVYLFNFPPRM